MTNNQIHSLTVDIAAALTDDIYENVFGGTSSDLDIFDLQEVAHNKIKESWAVPDDMDDQSFSRPFYMAARVLGGVPLKADGTPGIISQKGLWRFPLPLPRLTAVSESIGEILEHQREYKNARRRITGEGCVQTELEFEEVPDRPEISITEQERFEEEKTAEDFREENEEDYIADTDWFEAPALTERYTFEQKIRLLSLIPENDRTDIVREMLQD